MIHNGADDNASGTAGLIELAKQVKKSKLRTTITSSSPFRVKKLGLFWQ